MKLSFRQACILSLTLHLLLAPGIGWLAGSWLKSEPASQLIEIELAAGGPGQAAVATGGAEPGAAAETPPASTPAEAAEPEASELIEPVDTAAEPVMPVNSIAQTANARQDVQSALPGGLGSGAGGVPAGGGLYGGSGLGTGAGAGSNQTGSTILPPRVLKRIEPEYPPAARRANQEGDVGLRIEILANGLPGSITVVSSSGYQVLDDAAETAVRKWRFVPARSSRNGSPVASTTNLSVAFRLR